MQISSNTTPFLAELFVSTDKHARKHCVVVVKATFDVDSEGQCRPAQEQAPFIYADEHFGDPGTTAIRYESDFAPVKPMADILVNAKAIAPGGRAATSFEVALAGPGFTKRARIMGDRVWEDSPTGIRASESDFVTSLPLTWERAFGGSDQTSDEVSGHSSELRNLVGQGFHRNSRIETILGKALPNIEAVESPMHSWSDKPVPIGFGPLGRGWRPRIGFAGTYDKSWMDRKLPFLPDDFDDRYFQSAPADQQVSKLQTGDKYGCLNMSQSGRFVVQLPGHAIPVRFLFEDRTEPRTAEADTLILEPGAARIILVARTSLPLPRKFTTLREIEIGTPKRRPTPGIPRFHGLGEAVAALRRPR